MTPESQHEHRSALAYLKQAAEQLMEEQKFHPASDAECLEWMRKNVKAVGQRAMILQQEMFNKCQRPGVMEALTTAIQTAVYCEAHMREAERKIREA